MLDESCQSRADHAARTHRGRGGPTVSGTSVRLDETAQGSGNPESQGAHRTVRDGLTGRGDRKFRPDIQGLRAIAVVLVVLYHCGVPGIAGGYVGVDVFFVISGFLITRQLVSEHQGTGRISLTGFYARRIKRLLPSALTVIALTELVSRLWGPPLQAADVARDGIFSTFYLMNYRLAALGVDYQNAGGPVSPLQHFWSLAVEEQFYIFWPLIIIAVGVTCRRHRGTRNHDRGTRNHDRGTPNHDRGTGTHAPTNAALGAVVAIATAASFLVSIVVTQHNATLAYFAIQTRAWELGAGAILAIGTPLLLRLPAAVAVSAGWSGLLMIMVSAVLFTGGTPFPGSAAALPVAGAGLVVLAGLSARRGSAESILDGRVMQFLGRVSYGLYLWHWPVIVLAPSVLGVRFGWSANLAAALVALVLASLSNLLIEQAAARRSWTRSRSFLIGGVMSLIVSGTAVAIIALPTAKLDNTGPAAALNLSDMNSTTMTQLLDQAYANPSVPSNLTPSLLAAVDDVPPTSSDGCNVTFLVTTQPPCVFGDVNGSKTVVLFGDSHAEQWFGALDALARSRGWRLMSWTKAACPMADVLLMSSQLQRPFLECPTWRTNTIGKIAELRPDLVIASGSDALPGSGYSNVDWSANTVKILEQLKKASDQVVYLADVPAPTSDVPVCLAANLKSPGNCQFTVGSQTAGLLATNQFPGRHQAVTRAAQQGGFSVIDPTGWFCSPSGCPVVLRNTLVYRDATHMTQSYSRALEPLIGRALKASVPWMAGS